MKQKIDLNKKRILVTGSPGFIGANLVERLLSEMDEGLIVSLDNMNDYYDVALKEYRLSKIEEQAASSKAEHIFVKGDITDTSCLESLFREYKFDIVVNLAAQAGVRYSIENPDAYIQTNIIGFYNILEMCRHYPVQHLVYISSSSVYGGNIEAPFSESHKTDSPRSLYAATKKTDELLAESYSSLYGIRATGLRPFTVYGPAGRPDMLYFSSVQKLKNGESLKIYNYGKLKRDFTYIDDIVESIITAMRNAPDNDEKHCVYNIGAGNPIDILDFLIELEAALKKENILDSDFDINEHIELTEMHKGDVVMTYADTGRFEKDFGFKPHTTIPQGLEVFAKWYKEYYV